jgi:hypothetical protein
MHVFTAIISIIAAWRWGDWRNWKKYHSTMLFVVVGNLTYNFICANHFLWRLIPEFFSNHTIAELGYTFIVFPANALLFLSNYPDNTLKKTLYYIKWIFIYIIVEYLFLINNGIIHDYGWNIWWSLAFISIMFPLLRLHYTKPLLAYLFAIAMGSFIIFYFDVPVEIPMEFRK